jgi:cell division protein ZapA
MNICGENYTLIAEESPSYMERVGNLVNEQLTKVMEGTKTSRTDAAILAAINIADELLKSQESAENLRRQLKTYLDEAAQAKNEVSELKRQLFKAQNRK